MIFANKPRLAVSLSALIVCSACGGPSASDEGICVRVSDGKAFAVSRALSRWQLIWVYTDANDISHRIDERNSHEFRCVRGVAK